MSYFKLLEIFVLSVLFDKSDYNFRDKRFKPMKILVVGILTGNVAFTVYLLQVLTDMHDKVALSCPDVLTEAERKWRYEQVTKPKLAPPELAGKQATPVP